ncbi:ribonuclease H-like domain-containing protein [Tanacetum coccineum]
MSGSDADAPPPPPPPPSQTPTQQTPHTVSTIKLPILKKGEYDIWAMKMEHYLAHTDYPIWEVIQRGNGPVSVSTDTNGLIKVLPPKTAEETLARERERKARTTLLMALPEDHLAKFHKMTDAKEMWEAIKSRFGGNDESKKMQKYILKQQFEGLSVSNSEWLHKGYDRVFESDVKGSTTSSSNTQNVAFVSENTSSTNDVSTAYGVSNSSGHNSQYEHTSSYSLLVNQSSCPQLDHEDFEQLDEFDLEEIYLKWQVAMISMRMKKFYKKTGRKLQFDAKEPVSFDKTKAECYSCHKTRHFARECISKGNQDSRRRDTWNTGNKDKENGRRSGKQEDSNALVTLDGEAILKSLDELERLKRQEQDANDVAEALRKEFAQYTEDLLLQAGAAKASSTNIMDVKSAFLYGKIDEEVYVSQPPGSIDPKYPKKVYKVVKSLYGLHQAPRAWYATLSTFLLKNRYRRGTIDNTLFIKKDKNDIIQDKYVAEILKKFDFVSVKTTSTPIETHKPLVKDEEASEVDVHLYRSMIGSLMYLTASRPDIMFAVCACSRFQVTPKTSHLNAIKRVFRYLKANPNWAFGILECPHLTWKPTQIVTMLEQILTGNPQ